MSERAEHRVIEVRRDNETLDCTGFCTCGYLTPPSNDRGEAWWNLQAHIVSVGDIGSDRNKAVGE